MVFLYSEPKFLLSFRQYNIQDQFMEFSGNFKSLIDISGNLTSVKFSKILKLVEFGGFLRHKVNNSKILRLMDFSKFPKF